MAYHLASKRGAGGAGYEGELARAGKIDEVTDVGCIFGDGDGERHFLVYGSVGRIGNPYGPVFYGVVEIPFSGIVGRQCVEVDGHLLLQINNRRKVSPPLTMISSLSKV